MKMLGRSTVLVVMALALTGCVAQAAPVETMTPYQQALSNCIGDTATNWPDGVSATWTDEPVSATQACSKWQESLGVDEFTDVWLDPEYRARQAS